jgi:hypothetical protein
MASVCLLSFDGAQGMSTLLGRVLLGRGRRYGFKLRPEPSPHWHEED